MRMVPAPPYRAGSPPDLPLPMTTPPDEPAPVARQRLSVRAVVVSDGRVLLARISGTGFSTAGRWTLPGGGVDHGEHPEDSLRREVYEETGLHIEIGPVLGVHSRHFTGMSPSGVLEDFHGVHLLYVATVVSADEPRVVEVGGTTDAVAWWDVDEVRDEAFPASDVVRYGLALLTTHHRGR